MKSVKINIWGREFDLNIEYDCYTGEEVLDMQKAAVEAFIRNKECIEDSKRQAERYCLQNNRDEIKTDVIENIFKYVMPKYLLVKRDEKNRIVAIMCNYKFDMENGIAIVFENEKFVKIGIQDIVFDEI